MSVTQNGGEWLCHETIITIMFKLYLRLIITTFFIISTYSIIKINDLHKYTIAQIDKDPYITVQASSSNELKGLNREFLIIRVISKQQKLANSKMLRIEEKANNILKKYGIINNEDLLVKSKFRPQFVGNLRKWLYSTIFAIKGPENTLQKCYNQLE